MNIYAPRGTLVKYLNQNGYEYDREYANRYLQEGQVYTVESTLVDHFHTDVFIQEVPGKGFNSVMFEEVQTEESVFGNDCPNGNCNV